MSTARITRRLRLPPWGHGLNWFFGGFVATLSLFATITGFNIFQYFGSPSESRSKIDGPSYANPQGLSGFFLDRGIAYKGAGNHDRAIPEFTEAIKLNPNNATAYFKRGMSYNAVKDYPRSIADFDKAISINPGYADAFQGRCNSHRMNLEIDVALSDCNRAIELMGTLNAALLGMRANIYLVKGFVDEAIADNSRALQIDPNDAWNYSARGDALKRKNDFKNAIADYNRAIALDPNNANFYSSRAGLYEAQGLYVSAISDLDLALRRNPADPFALNSRCVLNNSLNQFDRAMADCNASLKINSRNGLALNHRGIVHFRSGRWDEAIADFSSSLLIGESMVDLGAADIKRETDAMAHYGLGMSRIKKGDLVGGRTEISVAKAMQPRIESEFAAYGIRK